MFQKNRVLKEAQDIVDNYIRNQKKPARFFLKNKKRKIPVGIFLLCCLLFCVVVWGIVLYVLF